MNWRYILFMTYVWVGCKKRQVALPHLCPVRELEMEGRPRGNRNGGVARRGIMLQRLADLPLLTDFAHIGA